MVRKIKLKRETRALTLGLTNTFATKSKRSTRVLASNRKNSLPKSKRSQSEMIAYVLLIIIAVSMSIFVYRYMKTYVPAESQNCPDAANLVLKTYLCDSRESLLYLELENKGLFTIDAFKIKGTNDSEKEVATVSLGQGEGNKGYYLFSEKLEPGKKETKIIKYTSDDLNTLSLIEILPSIIDNGKSVFCSNAVIKQKVVCNYDSSLVMWLKFDGTTYDSSKYYNNGDCNVSKGVCPTVVSGASGKSLDRAYKFNGSQYLTVLNNPSINFDTGSFSVMLKVNATSSTSGGVLLDKTKGGIEPGYMLTANNFLVYTSGYLITSGITKDSKWHSLAYVVNCSSNLLSRYVDGDLFFTQSYLASGCNSVTSDTNLTIGSTIASPGGGFNGTIDDVRIYSRALSQEDIRNIYGGT